MSPLLFVTPLAALAAVCLWLGWMRRFWLFLAWAAFWTMVVVIGLNYTFADTPRPSLLASMGAAAVMLQASIFATGWLARRAREIGLNND